MHGLSNVKYVGGLCHGPGHSRMPYLGLRDIVKKMCKTSADTQRPTLSVELVNADKHAYTFE